MQEICSREQRGDGMMIFWCRILILISYLPFSALPLCHAGLISRGKRSHLCWLSVGKSFYSSQCQPPSLVPVQRGPVVGLRELPATGPGWVVPWCERHSLVTACEHERHFLISSALFAFMQPIRKGWRKCFWILLHHLQYDFFSVWQESQFSSLENASEIFFY